MSFVRTLSLFAAALSFTVATASAQPAGSYQVLNPPQPVEGSGKVEVIEFFWYGCPHCYSVEPAVQSWLKRLPKDVVFRRIPSNPSDSWGEMAKVFYTFEAMGLLDQYHQKIFEAMHGAEVVNLANKRIREEWLKKNGVDVAKYNETEKSFTVATKLSRARQLTQNYRVDSVPRFFVNGKYYTSGEGAGGPDGLMKIIDQLVEKARKEKG